MACASSEDSDQPGHPPSLIRVYAVRIMKAWDHWLPIDTQRRLWSDLTDAEADLSLLWAHLPFCRFCHALAHFGVLLKSISWRHIRAFGARSLHSSETQRNRHILVRHYENAYSNILKNSPPKTENFQIKNSDISHVSAQNIDCGYSLEPPRRGGSNEYPQSMFSSRNKKNNVYPCKPQFYYIKVGFKGVNVI